MDPISGIAGLIGTVIDKIFPNADEAAKAKLAVMQMQQNGELAKLTADTDLAKGQLAVDTAEAQSTDPLQHWRGGAGWVCVFALAVQFCIMPLWAYFNTATGHATPMPTMDTGPLMTLMGGMLGLGGWHVYERTAGKGK